MKYFLINVSDFQLQVEAGYEERLQAEREEAERANKFRVAELNKLHSMRNKRKRANDEDSEDSAKAQLKEKIKEMVAKELEDCKQEVEVMKSKQEQDKLQGSNSRTQFELAEAQRLAQELGRELDSDSRKLVEEGRTNVAVSSGESDTLKETERKLVETFKAAEEEFMEKEEEIQSLKKEQEELVKENQALKVKIDELKSATSVEDEDDVKQRIEELLTEDDLEEREYETEEAQEEQEDEEVADEPEKEQEDEAEETGKKNPRKMEWNGQERAAIRKVKKYKCHFSSTISNSI